MKIGFIGAGKAGKALGLYFKNHGLDISGYCSRTENSALFAAGLTGSHGFPSLNELMDMSDVIFFTVPDHALEYIDASISELIEKKTEYKRTCFLHVSGALPSSCLKKLSAAGAVLGSMHPLLSFGEPNKSAAELDGALFTIEGTDEAVIIMQDILKRTGGDCSTILPLNKPLYHAGASVVSNFLVTLIESGIRCFETAGVDREKATKAMMPLIYSTLENIRTKGTTNALTGPIVRGDCNTIKMHLEAFRKDLPGEKEFYKTMAKKTVGMISGTQIDKKQEKKLIELLEEN